MAVSVGIDLGTTFSAVAYIDPQTKMPKIIPNSEGKQITPSIIQFIDGKPIFGSEAESAFNAGESGCAATFKRSMGRQEVYCTIDNVSYTAEDLSALLLRHLKEDAEAELGDSIQDAVITVPAYFYSPEREATLRAATAAGLKVKKIIDEPNAAAMAYGLNNWRENANILVFDLGGGTFDVTLVRMGHDGNLTTITTRGDHYLGGRDWDDRLENMLIDKFAAETGVDTNGDPAIKSMLRGMTEGVKKKLSSMDNAKVSATIPGFGSASVTVTRQDFEENSADLMDRTGSLCQAVLDEAGLTKGDVTDILLVGGSTRMPQVSEYIQNQFGKKPIAHVNPDEAVALGAAIQTTKENEQYAKLSMQVMPDGKKVTNRKESGLANRAVVQPSKKLAGIGMLSLRETTAHAMGMIAMSTDRTRYINDIIIPANHPRPVRVAKAFSFYTSARNPNDMEIYVLQGDKEAPLDCLIPYKYVVSGIRHIREQKGQTTIKVQYSYDNNGIIHVEARQENERKNLSIRTEPVPEDMSQYGIPIDPELFKAQPEPLNVVMAVDVSGSMSGDPLADAQRAMCNFVQAMDFSYTKVGIVAVSDSSEIVCELTDNESACIWAIQSITCGQTGYGNSAHPFDTIKQMLLREDGRLFALVLADGVWDDQSLAVSAAKDCNAVNIETAAIGFGGADEAFLRDISSNDANAMLVAQSELSSAFGTIAQSLGGGGSARSGADGTVTDVDTWEE
ncbi:MAG: Hsp70 family protein [Spirochaetaceae bacterium]|jgi:molecular chaperone DnaK|nr:Hsp70 family protein [Spirochaetaceae bacterium]